jgi:hypothetical protein
MALLINQDPTVAQPFLRWLDCLGRCRRDTESGNRIFPNHKAICHHSPRGSAFRIICRQIVSGTTLTLATNASPRRADRDPVVSP